MSEPTGPLKGLKVFDLTRVLPGFSILITSA
jgi:crotonobetainyl-CoA:carnitine CoA-transferase CaiB-like acyl-CoA transferase